MITKISRCLPLALMALVLSCGGGDAITGSSRLAPGALLNQSIPDTTQPWVRTNKNDYIPGEMVLMVGGTFLPGEQVKLTLTESPELHDDREFTITADADGNFRFDQFRPEEHHVGVGFVLTALGLTSGSQAQTMFTDAIVLGSFTTGHNGEPVTAELSIQKPSTVASGHFMIAQVTVEGLGTSDVICTPSGWNLIFRTDNSSALSQAIFWRVAGAAGDSDGPSYTWKLRSNASSCAASTNTVQKAAVGGIISYSGVDATNPIFGSAAATGDATTFNSPTSIANVPAGSRVVRFFGNDKEFQVLTSGSGSAAVYSVGRFNTSTPPTRLKPNGAVADGTQATTGSPTVVTASNPNSSGSNQGGKWVAQTIALREAAALPTVSINDVTANEGNSGLTNFTFTITRSAVSAQSASVSWAAANGTTNPATGAAACGGGTDYKSSSGTATIAANQTTTTVVIEGCGDLVNELNETFLVNLSNPSANVTILDNQGVGTITNDDGAPAISIGDVTQAEGSPSFTFTASLSVASSQTVTASFATANGSSNPATGGASCDAGVDYVTQTGGTVTFNPGETSKTVTVTVCDDALDEVNETFEVNLSSPTNATIGDGQGLGTITDDDASPSLSIDDVTQSEGNSGTTNFTFTVTLSAASGQGSTVNFSTANGTTSPATGGASCGAGVDYVSQTGGTVTFNPGETSKSVTVAVCGDALDEANETFVVDLSAPANATITDSQGLGTITDDDASPSLSIDNVTQSEGNTGTTNFTFDVTLSAASAQTVTVDFATAAGTTNPATAGACGGAGVDFATTSGTRTFTPGDVLESITVAVCADAVDEANETFFVNLSNESNATISDGQGLGTITDDDASPTLSIDDVSQAESSPNFIFTVRLTGTTSQTVTVNFATATGTTDPATGGSSCGTGIDYVDQTGGVVTFNAGETSKTVTATVCNDALDEANETFVVDLSSPTNATIADAKGIGTITDDDLPADQVGPVTSNVVANPNPVMMNTSFELTARVDDSNTGNSNIASAQYSLDGGGSWASAVATATPAFNTSPIVNVKWTVPGQPTDVYSICVRGTDAAGNTGVASCILHAVYDPSAGFVTGGGWITSPLGAYAANPTLTGRANFGFVSKYKKGANVPDGSTEFQFQAAGLNFHSTSYDWLVVAGQRAQFKGLGRLNGIDGHGFLLTAINGTPDKFRIKITNPGGTVVYDNEVVDPTDLNAATTLGGGNIVIHKP